MNLHFSEATTLKQVCDELSEAAGVKIALDPSVDARDEVRLDLRDVTLRRAFELLSLHAGVFVVESLEDVFLVAADNQANRRQHERQLVKIFELQNARVRDVNALLRGIVDVRKTAVNESLNTITVRDTANKIAIIEELVRLHDRPGNDVAVSCELLLVKHADLASILSPAASDARASGLVTAKQLARLKRKANTTLVLEPTLSIQDGRRASMEMVDTVRVLEGGGAVEAGLSLTLQARIHPGERQVSLDVDLNLTALAPGSAIGPATVLTERSLNTSLRLADGNSYLLGGLMGASGDVEEGAQLPLASATSALSGSANGNEARELVLVLTPNLTLRSMLSGQDLMPLDVGTERRTSRPRR